MTRWGTLRCAGGHSLCSEASRTNAATHQLLPCSTLIVGVGRSADGSGGGGAGQAGGQCECFCVLVQGQVKVHGQLALARLLQGLVAMEEMGL